MSLGLALAFLEADSGHISSETAISLLGRNPIDRTPAAVRFDGRPPVFPDIDSVAKFLAVTAAMVNALLRTGRLAPIRAGQDGFDADGVLGGGRFLEDLVGAEQLSRLIGAEIDPVVFSPNGLFPLWNPSDRSDQRTPLERVVEIHSLLALRVHQARPPERPLRLGELAASAEDPCSVIMREVHAILAGTQGRLAWQEPFKWTDLEIEHPGLGDGTE